MPRNPAPDDTKMQNFRSAVGGIVVAIGDFAIVAVCIFVLRTTKADTSTAAVILSGAFTAIVSMTSAYFGIRAVSNVAQSAIPPKPAADGETAGPAQGGHASA